MPIIAPQHKGSNPKDPYDPACDWPEDCTVQWGSRGIVLSEDGARGTAFFEAFPKGPGFFRGEGGNLAEAEKNCFEKYARFAVCDHQWSRGFKVEKRSTKLKHGVERSKLRGKTAYTNGGAICKKCKAFASMFKPITTLGDWKMGPSVHDLTMAAEGWLRPPPGSSDGKSRAYAWKSELRLRAAGIDLPPTPDTPAEGGMFSEPDAYEIACRSAVVEWYTANRDSLEVDGENSMSGLFTALDFRTMDRLVLEDLEYKASQDLSEVTAHEL
jgi:hypothetical protein